jgi:hypothetical protein
MAEQAPWETEASAEQAPWATEAPLPQRGVLQRAGEETVTAAKELAEGAKAPFIAPSKEEAAAHLGFPGMWKSFKETGSFLATPLRALGVVTAAPESVLASGLSQVTIADPSKQKAVTPGSEEAYEVAKQNVGTALQGIRAGTVRPPAISRVERGAAEEITRHATDLPKVEAALAKPEEFVPGSQPTTFQVTGDPGLGQLERTARLRPESTPAFVERGAEQNAARIRALEGVEPGGAPGDVASHLREALRVEQAQAEQMVKAAQQRAWEASQLPGGTYDPVTYGNVFRREIEQAEEAARTNERGLWRAVDPNGVLRVNPQPMQELERGIYGTMTEAGAASLTPAEKQISELISGYVPQGIPFKELTDLRSLTSSALRQELSTNGRTPAYARLSQLRQGIEDALERSVSMPIPGGEVNVGNLAAQRVREASAATAQRAQTFRPLRDVTRREGAAGPYRMGESQVAGRIIQPGAKGYDSVSSYLRAVGNERGLPDVQDAIAASMRREAIGPDGLVNPKKLESWLKRHQDALRAIDERDGGAFSQTLRNAGTAQEALETAQARQLEVADRYAKEDLGKIIGTTDDAQVMNVIGGMFGKHDSVARVRNLMSKLTTPEAQAGARRAVLEYIQQRFLGTQQLGEDAILRGGRFIEFVRNNAAALRQALSLDQFNQLQMIAKDLLRTSQSATGKAIPGGSDTAQNVAGLLQRAGGVLGKAAIDTIASTVPGGPLLVRGAEAGFGFRRARNAAKVQSLTDKAMLEPELARDLLARSKARKVSRTSQAPLQRSITGAAIEAGALSERKGEKGKGRVPRQTGGYVPLAGISGRRSAGAQAPTPARELRTGPSQTLSHARAPRFQEGREVSRHDDTADASRAQEPFIDPMSGAPANEASLRTIGRGAYNIAHGVLVDLPKRFFEETPRVMEGDPDTEIGRANVDLLAQMVGMPKPMGSAGVFGGRLSKTANLDLLAKAERMAGEGAEAKSIWAQTGWFRGADGKWRYEIPDVNAKLTPPAPVEQRESAAGIRPVSTARERFGPLEKVIEHPEFHEAYPQLSQTTVDLTTSGRVPDTSHISGYYAPAGRETPAHISLTAGSEEAARSGLLHEMQHGVQDIEGFAPGADPRALVPASKQQIAGLARRTFDAMGGDWSALTPAERKTIERQTRFRVYEKHAGETEARNVQARRNQEHLGPPWLSEDIPREQQIIPQPRPPEGWLRRPFTPGRQALEQAPVAGLVQQPRLASPEEITRAAQASQEMTYPQLRQLYRELGLTGTEPSELVRPALRPQPMEAIARATELKLADQRVLDTLTPEQRRAFQIKGKLPEGVLLPSQEAAAPAEAAMEPTWKEVAKAQEAYKRELMAGRGTSIFDVSPEALLRRPDVPQFVLPRTAEKRTERLAPAFAGNAGLQRLERAAGAASPRTWGWYNIQEPIGTFEHFHPGHGADTSSAWLDALAGTSMVNPISSNVRGSSWYLNQILRGEPLPQVILVRDPVSGKTLQALAGPPPAGYGAKAQVHHAQRVREFLENLADPVENMKPMSYRANLGGNYLPRTVDTHDIRNMVGMPYATEKPMSRALLPGEYVALENLGRVASQRANVPQAMQQAGTWIGGGGYTKLKSIPIPLAEELSRRSHITGMVRGIRPEEAWMRHVRGIEPLLARGGLVQLHA